MDYTIYINDKDGKTVVVVPIEKNPLDSQRAVKVANKHFKAKVETLKVAAGFRKGNKVSTVDNLSQKADCWMIWRK